MTIDEDEATSRLLQRLRALGSPVRLQLLKALVTPSRANDLRIRAATERVGFEPERLLGRSTVIEHLGVLEEAGLVRRVGDLYATDQQAMVALLQDVGDLARLRALVEVDVEVTLAAPAPHVQPLPHLPRVLVANGPEAGRAFALRGEGPWRVGRGSDCELALPHDPHVSREHVALSASAGAFRVAVARGAKNPVFLDFGALAPGDEALLRPGALLMVGATLLVLQA